MIACLTGRLIFADPVELNCIIDCCGVGYCVALSAPAFSRLPQPDENGGAEVRLFTHMQVREDAVELYGFPDRDELRCFKMLITVSGVGPKAFPTLSGASQTKRSAGKGSVPSAAFTSAVSDARDALLVLGYSQADVNEALSFCDTSAGTDEIIKAALAYLTSN